MKKIIIVGAGGFAKELFGYIKHDIKTGFLKNTVVKGFLDISEESFLKMNVSSVYLGSEHDYLIEEEDCFLIAIGDVDLREKVIRGLERKNATFLTYIYSNVFIDSSAIIGKGVVICPFSMVNSQAVIGDYSLMNIYTSVAHDSVLGKNSVLSPYSTLNGNATAGKNLFMGTRSTILPNVVIGDNCVISAGTLVSKKMDNQCMAFNKLRASYLLKK